MTNWADRVFAASAKTAAPVPAPEPMPDWYYSACSYCEQHCPEDGGPLRHDKHCLWRQWNEQAMKLQTRDVELARQHALFCAMTCQGGHTDDGWHHPHCSVVAWPGELVNAINALVVQADYAKRQDALAVLERYGLRLAQYELTLQAWGLYGRRSEGVITSGC